MTNHNKTPGLGSRRHEAQPGELQRLLEELRDYREQVRQQAAQRLGDLHNAEAVSALIARLKNDQSPSVRQAAIEALHQIGDNRAWPEIALLLSSVKDKNEAVRVAAAKVLGLSGDKAQAPTLVTALQDDSLQVRKQATVALGQVNNEAVIPDLIAGLPQPTGMGVDDEAVYVDALANMGGVNVANAVMLSAAVYTDDMGGFKRDENNGLFHYKGPWDWDNDANVARLEKFYRSRVELLKRLGHLQLLNGKGPSVDVLAILTLAEWSHEKSIEYICQFAVQGKIPAIRWLAVRALETRHTNKAVETLLVVLQEDDDWIVRLRAAESLGTMKAREALTLLRLKAASSEHIMVRYASLKSLGLLKDERALPTLGEIIWDEPDIQARVLAAEAMGEIGSQEAFKYLLSALGSDLQPQVRISAATAIGLIGSQKVLNDLSAILKKEKDPYVRIATAQAAARSGSDEAVKLLGELLYDRQSAVGKKAAKALGQLKTNKAISLLGEVIYAPASDHDIRQYAIETLVVLKTEVATNYLLVALKKHLADNNQYLCRNIVEGLGRTGSTKAGDFLLSLLRGKSDYSNRELWEAVIKSLVQLKYPPSFKRLQQIARDENQYVRHTAKSGLDQLKAEGVEIPPERRGFFG